ncbi:hypothetical protein BGZ79_008217 [Entomortierella chlamydospora]|nr:hypothetical protein BGZ79_008217 [Entomortierella chlamydospora]
MLPRLPASANQHTLFPGNAVGGSSGNSANSDRQDLFGDATSHHGHNNQHRRDAFRYNHHPAHRQYPYNQHSSQQPHPEHLVDRRGYSKDSYTSCSWTLSLADICSQIVGEKLFDNPHYFCHANACPYKKMRKANATNARADIIPDESQMDGCTMMMMPEWVTEQLGLHHLSELRKAVHGSDNSDQDDGAASNRGSGSTVDDAAGSDWGTTAKEGIDLFSTNNKHDLLEIPAPMQLTLKEKEMECEFCSGQ